MSHNSHLTIQIRVLPSISPPDEDILLRFKNVVPIASSLVNRSLSSVKWRVKYRLQYNYHMQSCVGMNLALTSHTW